MYDTTNENLLPIYITGSPPPKDKTLVVFFGDQTCSFFDQSEVHEYKGLTSFPGEERLEHLLQRPRFKVAFNEVEAARALARYQATGEESALQDPSIDLDFLRAR